jgi:hypothetical protein
VDPLLLLVPPEVGIEVVADVVALPEVDVPLLDVALLAAVLTVLPVLVTPSVPFEDSASGELLQATPPSRKTRPSRDLVLVIIASYHFLSYRPTERRIVVTVNAPGLGRLAQPRNRKAHGVDGQMRPQ